MRIGIVSWSRKRVGGIEAYLADIVPALLSAGHKVAFWCETDRPFDRMPIQLPDDVSVICASTDGTDAAVAELRAWNPDLLYVHGLEDPEVERLLLDVAPAVLFFHGYYGTCISGAKTFKNPVVTSCDRTFGWQCLAQYYPRRCGGWNPMTMVREFRRQSNRFDLLARYKAIVTLSAHMQRECTRHGLKASCVFGPRTESVSTATRLISVPATKAKPRGAWRLLFAGRMEALKGGQKLIQSLPTVVEALGKNVHVTFAGDGPERQEWEHLAAEICVREPRLEVNFLGWVGPEAVEELFAIADLLVLPSLWPEPFGLVGLEAARHGLPVAAFAVGGIPEWLQAGVNGHLASGDPPTSEGLAQAIVACLRDPDTHARLCDGSAQISAKFTYGQHVDALLRVFADVARAA